MCHQPLAHICKSLKYFIFIKHGIAHILAVSTLNTFTLLEMRKKNQQQQHQQIFHIKILKHLNDHTIYLNLQQNLISFYTTQRGGRERESQKKITRFIITLTIYQSQHCGRDGDRMEWKVEKCFKIASRLKQNTHRKQWQSFNMAPGDTSVWHWLSPTRPPTSFFLFLPQPRNKKVNEKKKG